MRNRKTQVILFVVLGAAVCAAVALVVSCSGGPFLTHREASDGARMAHGGTTPPNDAAYDAMFFKNYGVNPFIDTDDDHLSTFAVDVDTGSYTVCRRYLNDGNMPPGAAARTEEFLNYFDYRYAPPIGEAFAIYMEGAPSKFGLNDRYKMLKIGIKGREISAAERKDANLVFVIDVSGSMDRENRLGLVKQALRLLVDQLREGDRIGIVVYGTNAHKVLDPTSAADRDTIIRAIESLHAEGVTNAEEGIVEGYKMAESAFEKGKINRVILCSDGVANVGRTGPESIFKRIEEKAKKGIYLSTVGFGMGNYNDVLMEQLGDKGNGHYAYVDTIQEARRIFVENLTGTLQVIAKDVKVQVDFNPEVVSRYRLLGYENRRVDDEDFRDETVDGGEIGAGHSVTALYEIKFHERAKDGRVATVHVRSKDPDTEEVSEIKREIGAGEFRKSFDAASTEFRLAAGVAEFAEIMRKSYWAQKSRFADVLPLIRRVSTERPGDADIIELLDLVSKARKIDPGEVTVETTGE